jgi:acetoin utilization protein AcuB
MRVRDVTSPTLCVRYEEPSGLTLDRMRSAGVEHLIITRQKDIVGVASEKDLELFSAGNVDAPVGQIATAVEVLGSDAPVKDAANVMRARRVGCVPVVDDDTIAGIVTIEKLLELIGREVMRPKRRQR